MGCFKISDMVNDLLKAFYEGNRSVRSFNKYKGFFVCLAHPNNDHYRHLVEFNYERVLQSDPRFQGFLSRFKEEWGESFLGEKIIDAAVVKTSQDYCLIDFSTNRLSENQSHLDSFETYSYLVPMAIREVVHTYVSVGEERRHAAANIKEYVDLVETTLSDERSKLSIIKRVESILALDHRRLLDILVDIRHEYFTDESDEYSFLLKDDEYLVDIGASAGDVGSKFYNTKTRWNKRRYLGLEPNPAEFKKLSELFENDSTFKTLNAFVSEENGIANFKVGDKDEHGGRRSTSGTVEIPCFTIDSLFNDEELPTIIKIDAEGEELGICKSSKRVMSSKDTFICIAAYHYPSDMFDLVNIFKSYGKSKFRVRLYHPSLWDAILYAC
jgi:FkbM family methyltransferase